MSRNFAKASVVVAVIFCFIASSIGKSAALEVEDEIDKAAILARSGKIKEAESILLPLFKQKSTAVQSGRELGLIYYERNESEKTIQFLKESLAADLTEPATGELQKAIELAKSDKADEVEKILLSLLEDEETAARARYELGLIYESQGKLDVAATMFRNALTVNTNKGAVYVGVKTCKKCHLKLYKSWQKTKTAKSFEVLKPGVNAEVKAKLKFDPQKDYTRDAKCLECHTTGFGLPGGYKIPEPGDAKAAKRAKENAGITCEGCHGPGSKYIPVLKEALKKKRKYTQRELCDLGQFKVGARVCTTCHNRRNPTADSDYNFNFAEYKDKDTHEHFPLRYRVKE
ncbi:MAG: multiheme c-type cytochrome [Planctomycetota bacterium]